MQNSNPSSPSFNPIAGPFPIGTWIPRTKKYKDGHQLLISEDKKRLEVYPTDDAGNNGSLLYYYDLTSGGFVQIVVTNGQLFIQDAKPDIEVHIEISGSKALFTRLDELNAPSSAGITCFIGTDDVRQGITVFSNRLEGTPSAGINLRFDESSNKLIIEY
ncbi:MAG: hypothetical protein HUU01_04335 [Saprospiraceae bacterium]|nr:hypothetical protein [Saprospiraceae bacterium]